MAAALPIVQTCCADCDDPTVVNVPGAAGATGDTGATGTNGVNAYTVTTADFVMPANEGSVTISVAASSWCTVGQVLHVQTAGSMEVTNKPSSTSITLKNLETDGGAYSANAAPTTTISAGATVSPSGVQGPASSVTDAVGGDLQGTLPNPTLAHLATKGDLLVRGAASNTKLGVGTNAYVLTADSTAATGMKWAQVDASGSGTSISGVLPVAKGGTGQYSTPSASTTTALNNLLPTGVAAGDIFYHDGSNLVRLAKGTNGDYLSLSAGIPAWSTTVAGSASCMFRAVRSTLFTFSTEAAVVFNTEETGDDPDSTYDTVTGRWTPGAVGWVSLSVTLSAMGSLPNTTQSLVLRIKRYNGADATTTLLHTGTNSSAMSSGLYAWATASLVARSTSVTDYFYVTVESGYTATLMGSVTLSMAHFSGYVLP